MATETPERAESHISIDIEASCQIPDDDAACFIQVENDPEYNHGKSCFGPGEAIFFRVYSNRPVGVKTTSGNPSLVNAGIGQVIEEEFITFSNFSASSEYPIFNLRSAQWVGSSPGPMQYLQGTNQFYIVHNPDDETPAKGFGVLRISYETAYSLYLFSSPVNGDVVAYAYGLGVCSDEGASVTFQVRDDCATGAKEVTIIAKNAVTGETIEGAAVTIDGVFKGNTDSSGRLYVGILTTGSHSIRMTAAGYQNTDVDGLSNDSFSVSE